MGPSKKIQKHLLIGWRRINENKELHRIGNIQNATLAIVHECLMKVKKGEFNQEDSISFDQCEEFRSILLKSDIRIGYEIFGSSKTELVKDICKKATSGKKWCQLLYCLSQKVVNPRILEIGTNLGISGSYILQGIKHDKNGKFVTMEGIPELCKIARSQFNKILPEQQFKIKEGLYDVTFPELVEENHRFNLAFIDGNHKKEPTLDYFKALAHQMDSPAIMVFDDINWSKGMQDAWQTIIKDSRVNFYIDLYKIGIVIIDQKENQKNVGFDLFLTY